MRAALNKFLHLIKRPAYTVHMKLIDYVSKHGSKTDLARAIGAQPQLVWQWATGVRQVPLERCVSIELATAGAVSRIDLRPNDWQKIWPELAESAANSAQAAMKTVATGTSTT